jgi:hypothetical protein
MTPARVAAAEALTVASPPRAMALSIKPPDRSSVVPAARVTASLPRLASAPMPSVPALRVVVL